MPARHAFLSAVLILTLLSLVAPPNSKGQSGAGDIDCRDRAFTLDVPIQSDNPGRVIASLQRRGIPLVGVTIDREAAPTRTHISVGLFGSIEAAGRYGDSLVARGIIRVFLIKAMPRCSDISRPRKVGHDQQYKSSFTATGSNQLARPFQPGTDRRAGTNWDFASNRSASDPPVTPTSRRRQVILALAPGLDPRLIPRPDPVSMAVDELIPHRSQHAGGLWIQGDLAGAVSRLKWITGDPASSVVGVASDGRVTLNSPVLLKLSGADRIRAGADLVVADYIKSNEGLYLLTQLISAAHRYCLYVGQQLPTAGREVPVHGSINLDDNFDPRINPYRKDGMKLPQERPPAGFDSIVAINPAAVWFNMKAHRLVPDGMIAFHELAEALAKVESGLVYLPVGLRPGAHDTAMQREMKLSSQRPESGVITTAGSNRVFGNEKDFLEFRTELQ